MGDTQHSQPDQGAKLAAQKKLMESVITALRDNHDALPFLPEMMEQFIEMYQAGVGKKTGAHNVDVSRYRRISLLSPLNIGHSYNKFKTNLLLLVLLARFREE